MDIINFKKYQGSNNWKLLYLENAPEPLVRKMGTHQNSHHGQVSPSSWEPFAGDLVPNYQCETALK